MRQGGLILAVGCVRSKKKKRKNKKNKKSTPPKTHHDIHSSPATATTSRRRATRRIPRVSPYTPAFIDPWFVEIGLVQLSQLPMAKTASVASIPRTVVLQQKVQKKKEKKTTRHHHQQSSHRPPQGIPLLQSREAALEKVSDPRTDLGATSCRPLWSRHRLGRRVSTISKKSEPHLVLPHFGESPETFNHKVHSSDHSTSYY